MSWHQHELITATLAAQSLGTLAHQIDGVLYRRGVVGFVRSLAKRLAPEKIRVNAI